MTLQFSIDIKQTRMRSVSLLFLIMLLTCLSLSAQSLQPTAATDARIESFSISIDSLRKAKHIPGLAVAVVKEQELLWSEGFGASHFDTGDGAEFQAVSPDTPFWIASVTKTFIGLLFLQLEEQGKIDLDDHINDMPGWSNFCGWLSQSPIVFGRNLQCDVPISLRNVLNHTVNGEPGTAFMYNPLMYSRLSRYIEHQYGNPIAAAEGRHNTMAQLVQENILGPAGMERTMASQWQREKAMVFFDMAQGYAYKNGAYSACTRPERHLAGGAGIVSSVNELARYDIALASGKLGSAALMEKLFTPATAPDGSALPYAFGWYVQEYKGEKLIWHGGWDEEAGASALYLKVPERGLSVIFLANSEGMHWGNPLDKAAVERSAFAQAFLNHFVFDGSEKIN